METATILGHTFPRHPPHRATASTAIQRWTRVIDALRFARSQLTTADRALWVELCRSEARALTLLAEAREVTAVAGEGPSWLSGGDGL